MSDLSSPHLLLNAIRLVQQRHALLPSGTEDEPYPIVVGVSGGADSICLLHLLYGLAAEWHIALHVAHLDHALRPDSAEDAAFVQNVAAKWGLPCYCQRLAEGELEGQPGGMEAAARVARYRYLSSVACSLATTGQTPTIAVAHHADDQAETLLLNLVRGSGLRGLAGMKWVTKLNATATSEQTPQRPVMLIRPLLGVRRSDILHYLTAHQLTWREDATNQQPTYTRNYLRHTVLPSLAQINPQIVETLTRTADIIAGENERIEQSNRQLLKSLLVEQVADQRVVLNLAQWQRLSVGEQRATLQSALENFQSISQHVASLGFEHIEQLRLALSVTAANVAQAWRPLLAEIGWSILPDPWRLSLHSHNSLPISIDLPLLPAHFGATKLPIPGNINVIPGWQLTATLLHRQELPNTWRINRNRLQAFLDVDAAKHLYLSSPVAGMRIAPLGMDGHQKLLGDLFTDHKTPVALRSHWPLLVAYDDIAGEGAADENREVVWVCGHTIAHPARITEKTEQVVVLQWSKVS